MRKSCIVIAIAWPTLVAIAGAPPSACASPPESISGHAKVIDGDSLEIGETRIRLHAIDAFEGRQTCRRDGAEWNCGAEAAALLRRLVGGGEITCAKTDIDSYGRTVAICRKAEVDLGAEMVRAGYALAYRQYGNDYVEEEKEARAARRGAWSGEFVAPWDERHGAMRSDRTQPPSDAAGPSARGGANNCEGTGIKGNINRKGERIYHVPGSRSYDETIIDESKGERWFCTEQEAIRAGWRAPRG
jgi:endonuclease YncB( thermonuclease family)